MGQSDEALLAAYRSRYSSRAAWDAKAAQRLADEPLPYGETPGQAYFRHFLTIMVYSFVVAMVSAKLVWSIL